MPMLKKIISQSAIYFVGTIFSVLLGFFFKIFISSRLGAEGLGLFALGMSFVTIASIFLSWGYGNSLVRFVSKYTATNNYSRLFFYLKNTLKINLLMLALLAPVFFLFPDFIAKNLLFSEKLGQYLPLLGVFFIINSFLSIGDQITRGFQEVKKSTIIHHFIRFPFKIVITVALIYNYNLHGYIFAELLSSLLALILFFFVVKKLLPSGISFFQNKIKRFNNEEKKYAGNMLIIEVLGVLQNHGEKIMLVYFLSASELGIYSIVLSVVAFIPTILISVNSILSPIISQFYEENDLNNLSFYYRLSAKYVFIFSFPLIAFLLLYSKNVLQIFGDDFTVGYYLLVLVVLGELINVSFGVVGSTLKMMGYDKKIRNISVVSSVIAFISSYFFIESFGIIGMGFSYILKNLIYNLWGSIVLYRKNKIHILDINYLKTLFLYAIIFVACFFFFVFKNLSILDLVLIVGAFYIGYLFLWYIVLGKKEVPQLIELLQNDK